MTVSGQGTLTFSGVQPSVGSKTRRGPAPGYAERRRRIAELAVAGGGGELARLALEFATDAEVAYSDARSIADTADAVARHADDQLAHATALRGRLDGERATMEAERQRFAAERERFVADRERMLERLAAQATQITALERQLRRSWSGARPPGPVIRDPEGSRSQRPDPSEATTEAELMDLLRAWRKWAGNPPIRAIAAGSDGRISPTQVHVLLNAREIPARLAQLDGIIRGCGGTDEDRETWAAAWRVLFTARP